MKEINIPVLEGLFTWESRAIDYPLEVLAELNELKKQTQANTEIDQHLPVKDIESPKESDW